MPPEVLKPSSASINLQTVVPTKTDERARQTERRTFMDIFSDVVFAMLIFLIVCLLPLGVLIDQFPRRGLNHTQRRAGIY